MGFKRARNIFINRFSEIIEVIDRYGLRGGWASDVAEELGIPESDAKRVLELFERHFAQKNTKIS